MTSKQERLNEVYEHLRAHFGIHTQKDFAEEIRITRPALSSAMNGNEAYLTKNLFQKICGAFPGVFNIDYLLNGKGALLTNKKEVQNDDTDRKVDTPQPEIPDYVQRLCEESARLATRNEMLERQCENLIAELRDSKDKNEAFLVEIKASQKFTDALVADLRISRTQNDTLISELRETRKQNAVLTSELSDAKSKLDDALLSIEGMKNQLSMILGNMTAINDKANLATLRVNDDGEPVIMIHGLVDKQDNKKSRKAPSGYIKGDLRVITEKMVQQALKAFPDKKK